MKKNTQIIITVGDKFYNDIDENDIELLKRKLYECLDENCPCGWSLTIRKSEE